MTPTQALFSGLLPITSLITTLQDTSPNHLSFPEMEAEGQRRSVTHSGSHSLQGWALNSGKRRGTRIHSASTVKQTRCQMSPTPSVTSFFTECYEISTIIQSHPRGTQGLHNCPATQRAGGTWNLNVGPLDPSPVGSPPHSPPLGAGRTDQQEQTGASTFSYTLYSMWYGPTDTQGQESVASPIVRGLAFSLLRTEKTFSIHNSRRLGELTEGFSDPQDTGWQLCPFYKFQKKPSQDLASINRVSRMLTSDDISWGWCLTLRPTPHCPRPRGSEKCDMYLDILGGEVQSHHLFASPAHMWPQMERIEKVARGQEI